MRIGIIGGTGREGRGIAVRWAKAGHTVAIGSRDAARAKEKAAEFSAADGVTVGGGSNEWAVAQGDVVLLTVPYPAHGDTLRALAPALEGKILIDITVPIKPPKVTQVSVPEGLSAALEAQAIVGPKTRIVATLHHVSSVHLGDPSHAIECDVLTCSDDPEALATVLSLVTDLGLRGLDAGPLRNSIALEALTPVLLHLNRRYKSAGTGVKFTGIA